MKSILAILLLMLAVASCKTTEANYRTAYEKAVAGRDSLTALDQTIYGAHRRNMGSREIAVGDDTVEIKIQRVKITEGGGGINEWLRTYSVVVGQFKQAFNARSMRERLVDAGYPRAFVVETAEPYYYVLLSSYSTPAEAVEAIKSIPSDFPVATKSPLPFILKN